MDCYTESTKLTLNLSQVQNIFALHLTKPGPSLLTHLCKGIQCGASLVGPMVPTWVKKGHKLEHLVCPYQRLCLHVNTIMFLPVGALRKQFISLTNPKPPEAYGFLFLDKHESFFY